VSADEQLRLRERLAKLKRLSLLGGTRLQSDLVRLEKQLERIEGVATVHARLRRPTARGLC
jgi:hypothetical protein